MPFKDLNFLSVREILVEDFIQHTILVWLPCRKALNVIGGLAFKSIVLSTPTAIAISTIEIPPIIMLYIFD